MQQHATILIVDDDVPIGDMLTEALSPVGYHILRAYSGTEAMMLLKNETIDLILLDLMLPGLSGEEVLAGIKDIPVIVMSAKTDIDTKVRLLYDGACDYITKPFVISELLARCAAHLRMAETRGEGTGHVEETVIRASSCILYPELLIVECNDTQIALTRTEAAILQILMSNPGRPIGRSTILDRISEYTPDCTERSLKQHISNIRKKLQAADGVDHIEAVYGIGFKFS